MLKLSEQLWSSEMPRPFEVPGQATSVRRGASTFRACLTGIGQAATVGCDALAFGGVELVFFESTRLGLSKRYLAKQPRSGEVPQPSKVASLYFLKSTLLGLPRPVREVLGRAAMVKRGASTFQGIELGHNVLNYPSWPASSCPRGTGQAATVKRDASNFQGVKLGLVFLNLPFLACLDLIEGN
ncbi:hypothetical protein NE237_015870 [Protea cynaroides]|uniref:Uncharacterized protein n=1 Tax=Protea cynaroides TaxID=273540 RepID=A0A9Q0KEW2_9MAGN|nr:hypothetical protein NE237_015870 [Protea cynaroides]